MPKMKISERKFIELFKYAKKLTINFTRITPEIIMKNPKILLIFRLSFGMSQTQFEKICGNLNKNLTKYEVGRIKSMNYNTAFRISNRIEKNLKHMDLEGIKTFFKKYKSESCGWFRGNTNSKKALDARRRGASKSMELRRTYQERKIEILLNKLKIKHFVNYTLAPDTIVDFYLPERKIVIEAKKLTSQSWREITEQVQKLAYQGYKVKYKFKNFKIWAVIESDKPLFLKHKEELNIPFDEVFENYKLIGPALSS